MADFFENLEMVVVDEVHTYRGVLGSHMAQIFRRLHRICEAYGSQPRFVFSSATIANPAQLSETLIGQPLKAETKSGAPSGKRHFVFIENKLSSGELLAVFPYRFTRKYKVRRFLFMMHFPACVHSPKCGSGNRPIDKLSAVYILDKIINTNTEVSVNRKTQITKTVPKKKVS